MLRDTNLATSYDSYLDKPLEDFLIPCLQNSSNYDRAVGYFSSALLSIMPEIYTAFAEKGGRIRLICSPALSPQDAQIFENLSKQEDLFEALDSEINDIDFEENLAKPLDLMAKLISVGALEIRFAIPRDFSQGIFHQKIGIFSDGQDLVSFSGSNNETFQAWWPAKNSEKFHVFKGWIPGVKDLADGVERDFNLMWANRYPGFDIVPFQKGLSFIKRREQDARSLSEVKSQVREWREKITLQAKQPDPPLRDYQIDVLENWKLNNYKGVVSFATGAGKTFTALAGISHWVNKDPGNTCLILVPSIRLQKQWQDEIQKFPSLASLPILLAGGDYSRKHWQMALRGFTNTDISGRGRLVIAVLPTAAKPAFYNNVSWGEQLLVVVDELHNIGATTRQTLLERIQNAGAKIGLSATPARYDQDENQRIRDVFDEDLKPEIGIDKAQSLGALVTYKYNFVTTELLDDELNLYKDLSRKIGALMSKQKKTGRLSPKEKSDLDQLRISRANVIKGAKAKSQIAANILRKGKDLAFSWLVFCNDQTQMSSLFELIPDLRPLTFHQNMKGDGDATLEAFSAEGGVMLAIEMMDEGVDIPSIENAILMASSQNPRQYIQRLGRILRKNKNRIKRSEVWDIIVLDNDGFAINRAETDRALLIAQTASNSSIQIDIERLIKPEILY